MLVGTYWCPENDCWIRVQLVEQQVQVEAAFRSIQHPNETQSWEDYEIKGPLAVFDVSENSRIPRMITIYEGNFYFSEWEEDKLTKRRNITVLDNAQGIVRRFISRQKNQENFPFQDIMFPQLDAELVDNLPLTPEAIENKWIKWKQLAIKNKLPINDYSTFEEFITEELWAQYKVSLVGLGCENFPDLEDYLLALEDALTNRENRYFEAIEALAARTDIDEEYGLNPDKTAEMRHELYQRKRSFFFQVIQAERQNLLQYIGREFQPIEVPANAVSAPVQHQNNVVVDDPVNPELLGEDCEVQQALLDHYAIKDTNLDPEELLLGLYKAAILTAQTNYENWYNGVFPHLRGKNTLFTPLRHGDYGQKRAKAWATDILDNVEDTMGAVTRVNSLLTDSKTCYHAHSFASFLLDELTKIEEGAWSNITMKANSNRYSKTAITEMLNNQRIEIEL